MDSILRSPVKVVYLPPHICCKGYNKFSFFSACLFSKISLAVSGFMELVEAKKSVMVGYQWRLEAGAYCAVNNVSLIRQCTQSLTQMS